VSFSALSNYSPMYVKYAFFMEKASMSKRTLDNCIVIFLMQVGSLQVQWGLWSG
jgi:hypothetical protein